MTAWAHRGIYSCGNKFSRGWFTVWDHSAAQNSRSLRSCPVLICFFHTDAPMSRICTNQYASKAQMICSLLFEITAAASTRVNMTHTTSRYAGIFEEGRIHMTSLNIRICLSIYMKVGRWSSLVRLLLLTGPQRWRYHNEQQELLGKALRRLD